jgi:HK97 family phage major capsid protein
VNLNEMLAKRAQLVKDARALVEEARKENREFSAEEETSYKKYMDEVDAIRIQVDREQELREAERTAIETHVAQIKPDEDRVASEQGQFETRVRKFMLGQSEEGGGWELPFTGRDVRDIRFSNAQVRDLSHGTSTSGGYTVPINFVRELYQALVDTSTMRQTNARIITTADGADLQFPTVTTHSVAKLFAETSQITTSDPVFSQVTLKAYKYGVIVPVSRELIQDTGVDLLGYLAEETGRAIGINQGVDFAVGNGTSKPKGVIAAASFGVTAAGTNAITANNLIDLYHSLGIPYRKNAAFLMTDTTVQAVRKLLTAGSLDYVWQPGLQAGIPDTLLGRPLYTDPNIAALATASKVAAIGDFSRYLIRDVGVVRFERSDDFKFDTDMVYFKCVLRSDGNLLDTTAVKYLITS